MMVVLMLMVVVFLYYVITEYFQNSYIDCILFLTLLISHFPLSEKKSLNYLKIRNEINMVKSYFSLKLNSERISYLGNKVL